MSQPKDFSRPRERVAFTIDGDTFEAAPAIPAEILAEFATRYEDAGEAEGAKAQYQMLVTVLDLVLVPDSCALLQARMRDRERPVDLDQLNDIVIWLMEQYGLRPTQPSPSSSDGQPPPEPGTSSTEPTPDAASTSQLSLQTVS